MSQNSLPTAATKKRPILVILLVLIALGACGAAGYSWWLMQHKNGQPAAEEKTAASGTGVYAAGYLYCQSGDAG